MNEEKQFVAWLVDRVSKDTGLSRTEEQFVGASSRDLSVAPEEENFVVVGEMKTWNVVLKKIPA